MTQNYKPAYPAEFRQQMVELVALGKCPKQLSKEFGCHYTLIQTWCRAAGVPIRSNQAIALAATLSIPSLSANERHELLKFRKKLKRVEMEH
jgi:transposase